MTDDQTTDATHNDVSSSLRTALRHRPSPPAVWDMTTIKAHGRRRRLRARGLPVVIGLVTIMTAGGISAASDVSWPWTTTTTTTVAAAASSSPPERVVRAYVDARMAGDNARAFYDYWARDPDPGSTQNLQWSAEKLAVKDIEIGASEPYPTTNVVTRGWQEAVAVPLSYQYDPGPELVIGKAPVSGSVILVRDHDTDAWRIVSFPDTPD